MNWRAQMVLVGAVAAFGALLPAVADSPRREAPAGSHPPDRSVVRVEHELVPVTVIEETVAPAAAGRKPAGQRVRRLAPRNTRPDGFTSRARQLLVGNGRYRPEPFPRIGQ
jgi:hypothetical protein